jgi:hypothetical protein
MMQGHHLVIAFLIAALYPLLVFESVRAYHPFQRPQFQVVASLSLGPSTPEELKAQEERYRAGQKRLQEIRAAAAQAESLFYRALILVATPLGVATMILGSCLKLPAVGTGMVIGGFVSVTNAYWGYWSQLDDRTRYVSILLGIFLLVFIWHRYSTARTAGTT